MEIPKYPRTPHWPFSPSIGAGERTMTDMSRLMGSRVVITEKLDGSNVLLHQGKVYARSVSGGPAHAQPWLAMVRKHHAWKTNSPELERIFIYGEDIYGVHSIEYGPIPEEQTFYAFASLHTHMTCQSFERTKQVVQDDLGMPIAPVIHQGTFKTPGDLDKFLKEYMEQGHSALGGEIEGLVVRYAQTFPVSAFDKHVCKYVRKDHVQTDEHWTKHWRPCQLTPEGRIEH